MIATTHPSTPARRRNCPDTPARWAAALERATSKGLRLLQHDATGQWFCTGTDGRTVYGVSYFACECRAGAEGDPVCQHRAMFREQCRRDDEAVEKLLREAEIGMTDEQLDDLMAQPTVPYDAEAVERLIAQKERDEVPTFDEAAGEEGTTVLVAPAPVAPAPVDQPVCWECDGTGLTRMYTGGGLSDWVSVPCRCEAGAAHRTPLGAFAA